MDIRSIRLSDLRSQIAYVPQEPFMFAGTILENLTLGDKTYYPREDPKSGRDGVYSTRPSSLCPLDLIPLWVKGALFSPVDRSSVSHWHGHF